MKEHTIKITPDGIEFIYDDELVPLLDIGSATITRASHVEPHPTKGGWIADMRPSGGPLIDAAGTASGVDVIPGGHAAMSLADLLVAVEAFVVVLPFKSREEALAAERAWLVEHKGL